MSVGELGGRLKSSVSIAQEHSGSAGEVEFAIAIEIGGHQPPSCQRRHNYSSAKRSVAIPQENLNTR